MSYREIRNFTEIMRALGYPRLISMENFRRPNFDLVADILYWMVKLYDPETTISDRVEEENDRVEFLTGIAALMATRARIKLNTKKIYASDGRAVQELLKLANLLYKATRSVPKAASEEESQLQPIKVQDVRETRNLASDITQRGAKLYDLLASENANRQERQQAMRFLDTAGSSVEGSREHAFIERSLREIIDQTKQTVEDVRRECEQLEADEKAFESKIRKKQEDLERTEKRLRSLESVRPQFMDEVEKLEKELQRYYEIYMEKFRNLDYLEQELEQYHRNEEERRLEQERRLKKMRERLLREEVEILRGGGNREDGDEELIIKGAGVGGGGGGGARDSRGAGGQGGGGGTRNNGAGRVQSKAVMSGSMIAGESDESSESDGDEEFDEEGSDEELSIGSRDEGRGRKRGGSEQESSEFEDDEDDLGDDDGEGSDEDF